MRSVQEFGEIKLYKIKFIYACSPCVCVFLFCFDFDAWQFDLCSTTLPEHTVWNFILNLLLEQM